MNKITLFNTCHQYHTLCKWATHEPATLHQDQYGHYIKVGDGRAYVENGQIVVRMNDEIVNLAQLAHSFGMSEHKLKALIERDFLNAWQQFKIEV